jgi:single-strand DNA-binding protein
MLANLPTKSIGEGDGKNRMGMHKLWTKDHALHQTLSAAFTLLQEKSKQTTTFNTEGTTMNQATIIGNIGKDPELRFTPQGKAIANFSVGTTHLKGVDKEKETTWHDCVAFGTEAENIAASFHKGDRVIVVGRLEKSSYEKNGQKVYRFQMIVNEAGLSIKYDVAVKEKGAPTQAKNASAPNYGDEEPF